jgi:hypothetical protein
VSQVQRQNHSFAQPFLSLSAYLFSQIFHTSIRSSRSQEQRLEVSHQPHIHTSVPSRFSSNKAERYYRNSRAGDKMILTLAAHSHPTSSWPDVLPSAQKPLHHHPQNQFPTLATSFIPIFHTSNGHPFHLLDKS